MDWAKLIQDNAQSLFTLGGVIFGALLTLLGTYINNHFQAKERDKDRLEQRREAKIQAKEKWIERDILIIMDAIDNEIKMMAKYRDYALDELDTDRLFRDYLDALAETNTTKAIAYKLIYSLENERITNALKEYNQSLSDFRDKLLNDATELLAFLRNREEWDKIFKTAGELHTLLREKLISIRDTD